MARTPSKMISLGSAAPIFSLPDTNNQLYRLEPLRSRKGLLVIFLSNHCPFVKWIRTELATATSEFIKQGVEVVGIMSNDVANYPDDSPAKMKEEINLAGYKFPYLYDETQSVAKSYDAACTPDFFLYDQELKLVYRGQFDDSRPQSNIPVTGKDLRLAVSKLLHGEKIFSDQKPSLGCNIKWKSNS